MEYYAGIDVSLESVSICVVDASGRIIREAKVASRVRDGASSCAWPGASRKSTSRPAASQTPTIFVPSPPRERPSASPETAAPRE